MNAALKGVSTSISRHITIYSELNSYKVKYGSLISLEHEMKPI